MLFLSRFCTGKVFLKPLVPACMDQARSIPTRPELLGSSSSSWGCQSCAAAWEWSDGWRHPNYAGDRGGDRVPHHSSSSLPKPHQQHRIIPSLPMEVQPSFSPGSSSGPLLPPKVGNISSAAPLPLSMSLQQGNVGTGLSMLPPQAQPPCPMCSPPPSTSF